MLGKDFARRHPDFINAKRPDYNNHDPLYWMKLAQARDWLGRLDRANPDCSHRYVNSDGQATDSGQGKTVA